MEDTCLKERTCFVSKSCGHGRSGMLREWCERRVMCLPPVLTKGHAEQLWGSLAHGHLSR